MKRIVLLFFAGMISSACRATADTAAWPQWRGPNLNGTTEAKNLPTRWSETENVIWKTDLPWWSGSTPVIWGDRIFLTSPEKETEANKAEVERDDGPHAPGGPMLLLLCLNREDGKLLWQRELGKGNQLKRKHNMTSPSPVTDGKHIWIMTGKGWFVCFDFDGKEVWRRDIQADYGKFGQMWGYASSPLLLKDRLIVQVLHGWLTDEPSYLFAVDKKTGKTIWKTDRPTDAVKESPDSYSTPALYHHEGMDEIITSGGDCATGHDAATGAELWRVDGLNPKKAEWNRTITSPLVAGNLILIPSKRNPLTAIRHGGKGDVTAMHVLWKYDKGPDVPTPVSDGKHVWFVEDQGIFTCLDGRTGEPIYKPERLTAGTYSPSLVMADGKIYATSESAETTVLAATPDFKVLSVNKLDDEYTLSTPVIVDDRIYIRTSSKLYCIGNK